MQPSQGGFPQPLEGSFLQPYGQGSSEFDVQQASTCGSPDSVMQPSEPNINRASPPSNTTTARRLTGPIISLYMLVFTFGLLLFSRQPGNTGAKHVPRKLLLEPDQVRQMCGIAIHPTTPCLPKLTHFHAHRVAVRSQCNVKIHKQQAVCNAGPPNGVCQKHLVWSHLHKSCNMTHLHLAKSSMC